jgi:hypothetical protein
MDDPRFERPVGQLFFSSLLKKLDRLLGPTSLLFNG